jgi:hypothetical protein
LACNANSDRKPMGTKHAQVAKLCSSTSRFPGWAELPRLSMVDGLPEELAAFGNAVVPQCAEVIGHLIQELSA